MRGDMLIGRWSTGMGKAKGRAVRTLLVLMAVALGVTVAATPAHASGSDWGYEFMRSWRTGICMDSNSGTAVYTNPCQAGNDFQQWLLIDLGYSIDGNKVVSIKDKATSMCLWTGQGDPARGGFAPLHTGIFDPNRPDLNCLPHHTNQSEEWIWYGNDYVAQFKNVGWGLCIDSDGSTMYAHDCNGGNYQDWRRGY